MAFAWEVQLKDGHCWGVLCGIIGGTGAVCIPVDQIEGMSAEDIGKAVLSLQDEARSAEAYEIADLCDPSYIALTPDDTLSKWHSLLNQHKHRHESLHKAWTDVSAEVKHRAAKMHKKKAKQAAKRQKRKRIGCVYLLQAGPFYKIGVSSNVEKRVKQLSTLPPFDIELIHTIKDVEMYTVEKELHKLFASKRKKGEWFELDASDIEHIKGLSSGLAQ